MREWQLRVDDLPDPTPGPGQVLTKVLACGICGSDLHMLKHGAEMRETMTQLMEGAPADPLAPKSFEPQFDTVMGHEYCCEVVEVGPGVGGLTEGDVIVSFPIAMDMDGIHTVGYSNRYNGGYAELMVCNELTSVKVPTDVSPRLAAMTEPLAVGVHAVAKSRIVPGEAAIVIGAGPVGLACIAELRMRGIGPIVVGDFSAKRRELAALLGADEGVDPREESVIDAWRRIDGQKTLVVFEAVGVPGMIDQAMRMSPRFARVLVVGACMQHDQILPMVGIGKELNIQFVLGYEPLEFSGALEAIAEGKVDLQPWVTGTVPVDGVPQAFADLANPETHAKILVVP